MSSLAALAVLMSSVLGQAADEQKQATTKSLAENHIVGSWDIEGEIGGNPLNGTMRVRPGAGGLCLVYQWRFKVEGIGTFQATGIGGLDPETGKFAEYCFNSKGDHWVNRYQSDTVFDTGTGRGERTGTINGKITTERKDENNFVYTLESENGPNMTLTYCRAKDQASKAKKK